MAEAPSLGDFFAKKTKKKIKGSNLNKATEPEKEEPKKATKGKSADDEGWQEEEVVQATMKVEAAGKLIREEEKQEEQDVAAPAWGNVKVKDNKDLNEKRFPSLAKSVQSSAINLEDTSGKVNISTSKNMFANLEGDDDDDEDGPKRPKEIKPAMVTKKKGEREKDAIQREVGKYKDKKGKAGEPDDDDDEEEAQEEDKDTAKEVKPKKAEKKVKSAEPAKSEQQEEQAEDVKIEPDLAAAKAKYAHRKKLPKAELPEEELEEEKENKPSRAVQSSKGGKKKKFANMEEDEFEKKLAYADWD
eukprot:CAMPEP_0197648110 /NCGR_PEP_ID=MMETSP1338-20131121/27556_1 /TAXON_ID=43686 ORGANISM="Pelagodinium beii, Strain RCC1491" /NCGR_SAMPLE_ID=MMETSP1338 /ASSEMBLY_ACC=CAM_ASM_000754 /LENGTH=301 /DNA_ID=CAMNT_0043222049 /DNA_START=53 /DNA_END=958 /DNA_ORIENTATION=+